VITPEPYPRPRPPLSARPPFSPGTLLDVFDLAAFRELRSSAEVETAAGAPLPEGAQREREADLVTIRWIGSLRDPAAVRAARSAEERWLATHFAVERDPDFNAQGDRRERALGLQPHPPLTFYRAATGVGYKAIVAHPDGPVDEELWAEITSWVKLGRLPDGAKLEKLRLIVPLREAALAIAERAAQAGIDAVLYTDDHGQWWNPRPPGLWLEEA
jgi:hypothetical protein